MIESLEYTSMNKKGEYEKMSYTIFEELESNVRSYSRTFPISFSHAKKDILIDVDGNKYIDFFVYLLYT